MIGETISHFKITEKLGQGGMGVVYRGIDLDLDRPVAIKVLPPESQQDEDSVARFLREARTASKLQHPAITTIYEFGVKDNLRYIVMEFIEGRTLKQILKTGSMPIRQMVEITIQVADALSLAGEKAIIHRDIKSENIMLTDRGQVKILDFGLAKIMEKAGAPVAPDQFQTTGGTVMGTITHMSPEQALGAEVDARTDIYSTGVVMFEMTTGQLPFSGTSANVVLAKILNQPAPAPSDLNPEIPPSLERVIRRCLEKNREQRYHSASSLLMDLKAIKHDVEKMRDWSGTVVMASAAKDRPAAPAENLRELIPASPPAAASTPPSGGVPAAGGVSPSGRVTLADASSGSLATTPSGAMAAAMPGADTATIRRAIAETKEPPRPVRLAVLSVAFLLKLIRKTAGWAGGLYAFACVILFALTLLTTDQLRSLAGAVPFLRRVLQPGLDLGGSLLPFPLIFGNADFLPLAVGVAVYLVQLSICTGLERLEALLRRTVEHKAATSASIQLPQQRVLTPASASRMSMLREYAVAKRMLSEAQKDMAFLSIDVVGSTKMKLGEEKITIEHAFAEYKKFLERIFRECRVYKVAWTPDGVMVCFPAVDDAVTAGRKVITDLDFFNRDIHQMRGKFRVRCGVNAGVVLIPEEKPLEEVSDHTIDVAGHLQKDAEPDTLWVSGEVHERLMDRNGFARLDTQVDGHEVYAWRKLA